MRAPRPGDDSRPAAAVAVDQLILSGQQALHRHLAEDLVLLVRPLVGRSMHFSVVAAIKPSKDTVFVFHDAKNRVYM
jgi:hypothetical protein